MRSLLPVLAATFVVAAAAHAGAATVVPGAGDPGYDANLEQKAEAFDRQIHALSAFPLGFGLEVVVGDPANRALVGQFITSGQSDFKTATGKHPYEVVSSYGEAGDLGMFGGVEAAGDAFRYAVLRDSGAPQATVDEARAHLIAAMKGLHWFQQITGEPGAIARGLMRIASDPGEPPPPDPAPTTTPLFDANGDPLPATKTGVWRADRSGKLPFLVWMDDTSKDQFIGYVMAIGAAYDVSVGDPTIPASVVDPLVEDARQLGHRLMHKVTIGTKQTDLVLVDPDGRPTGAHDISAEELTPGLVLDKATNGFNAWMALGAMRTLYHMTGDAQIGQFYRDLVDTRGYLANAQATLQLMYMNEATNYSNVNMAFCSAYGLMRYENDPALRAAARKILEEVAYAPGRSREAKGLGQSFFDFMYAGFRVGGATGPGATAVNEGTTTLQSWRSPPTWDINVTNCDAAEIAAGSCLAVDGTTTITIAPGTGHGGGLVATDVLPITIRPPSDFEWRSDPHDFNGGGDGSLLDPGGDFHAAYWMGRFLSDTGDNLSPHARDLPAEGGVPDAGSAGAAGNADASAGSGGSGGAAGNANAPGGSAGASASNDSGGCGCHAAGSRHPLQGTLAALLALAALSRRRRRS